MPKITTVLFDLGSTLIYFDADWNTVMLEAVHVLHRKLLAMGFDLDETFPLRYREISRENYRWRDEELVDWQPEKGVRKVLAGYGCREGVGVAEPAQRQIGGGPRPEPRQAEDDALRFARLEPQRVERLVLVDSAGYPLLSESVPVAFQVARIPVLNRLVPVLLPRAMISSSLRNVYGHPERVTPELIDRYYDLATRAGNRQALVERFRQARPGADIDRLGEIRAPTLILWGGRDRLIPPTYAQRFAQDIHGSTLVQFDDLGHVPHEEDPQRTLAALQDFLARP